MMKVIEHKNIVLTIDEGECAKLILLIEKGISQIGDNPHAKKTKSFGESLIKELEKHQ